MPPATKKNTMGTVLGKRGSPPGSASPQEPLAVSWTLAELPTTQHRAGLAGLLMMVDYARRHGLPQNATLELTHCDENGLTLRLDQRGLTALMDRTYSAAYEEKESERPRKNTRTKKDVPPKRREQRAFTDDKGRPQTKEVWIYEDVVPHGGPLGELAPQGDEGRWIKLWRYWLWNTLRAIPKQRTPYEQRAERAGEGEGAQAATPKDVLSAWDCLTKDSSMSLASTYFLGAMDANAELVPFQDRSRFLFLLHFWPFTVHVFLARKLDAKGEIEQDGLVTCIPDVTRLRNFVTRHERALRARDPGPDRRWPSRPSQCLVDLPDAAVLWSERWLQEQVGLGLDQSDARPTAGFQVVHLAREGNSVRIRSNKNLVPTREQVQTSKIVAECWSHVARHTVLTNVFADVCWWRDFERILARTPAARTIGHDAFRRDVRTLFSHFQPEDLMTATPSEVERNPRPLESLVLHIVTTWIASRMENKYGLTWGDAKGTEGQKQFGEKKSKLATEAFLAARSRPGKEFSRWFTATLCSANQRLTEVEFLSLARALSERPDHVRSLTLLALSARG
jgi:CRISPR-associated protein Cmx8